MTKLPNHLRDPSSGLYVIKANLGASNVFKSKGFRTAWTGNGHIAFFPPTKKK